MSQGQATTQTSMPAPSQEYLPHLVVYVVWHPRYPSGLDLARALHTDLAGDPDDPVSEGVGVPVYYRTGTPGAPRPAPIDLDGARHTAVVVLVDSEMVVARDKDWAKGAGVDGPSKNWGEYVVDLWQRADASEGRHRILPVALTRDAFSFDDKIAGKNFIRFYEVDPEKQVVQFVIHATHELCRQVMGLDRADHGSKPGEAVAQRVEVFISHAKYDGAELAKSIRDHIKSDQQLSTFFDSNDIYFGSSFLEVIEAGVERSAMLVVNTDAYGQSEFCRGEVLLAKAKKRPIYMLDAVKKRVRRTFPYMYNGPSDRYQAVETVDFRPVVKGLLLEVLRIEHFTRNFKEMRQLFNIPANQGIEALPYPPELLTLVDLRQAGQLAGTYVYPDPPLSLSEMRKLEVLTTDLKDLKLTTPVLLLTQAQRQAALNERPGAGAARPPGPAPHPGAADAAAMVEASAKLVSPSEDPPGWMIGISVSDLPEADLLRLGFGPEHVSDTSAELALYLLAAQYRLAYGGDLRKKGFTEVLHELVARYNSNNFGPKQVLSNYLAWYIHSLTPAADRSGYARAGREVALDPPADLKIVDPNSPPDPKSPDFPYLRARCLTAMRERMNGEIQARVIVGGKTVGYNGAYPGVVEEAALMVHRNLLARATKPRGPTKPIYLIGGYGGAALAIIDAIRGGTPQELTLPYQQQSLSNPGYAAFVEDFNTRADAANKAAGATVVEPINYPVVVDRFQKYGIVHLSEDNGLSPGENETLFTTIDVKEMVYLVLKGLLVVRSQGQASGS